MMPPMTGAAFATSANPATLATACKMLPIAVCPGGFSLSPLGVVTVPAYVVKASLVVCNDFFKASPPSQASVRVDVHCKLFCMASAPAALALLYQVVLIAAEAMLSFPDATSVV